MSIQETLTVLFFICLGMGVLELMGLRLKRLGYSPMLIWSGVIDAPRTLFLYIKSFI